MLIVELCGFIVLGDCGCVEYIIGELFVGLDTRHSYIFALCYLFSRSAILDSAMAQKRKGSRSKSAAQSSKRHKTSIAHKNLVQESLGSDSLSSDSPDEEVPNPGKDIEPSSSSDEDEHSPHISPSGAASAPINVEEESSQGSSTCGQSGRPFLIFRRQQQKTSFSNPIYPMIGILFLSRYMQLMAFISIPALQPALDPYPARTRPVPAG
jgi:hypothetical protein